MKLNKNWYEKIKISKALDPKQWSQDTDPYRLREDYWKSTDSIEDRYKGVHLTHSIYIAGIYAIGKSTAFDPPIIIAIYQDKNKKHIDVDGEVVREEFIKTIGNYKNYINTIINNDDLSKEEKVNELLYYFEYESNDDFRGDAFSPDDIIVNQSNLTFSQSFINYIENINNYEESEKAIRSIVNGNIPNEMIINAINQYRIMYKIGNKKVQAIYKIERVNLDKFYPIYDLLKADEKELDNNGITRNGNYLFDEEGRRIIDYEDAMDGTWLEKTIIYKDKNSRNIPVVFHGTTLSRAKSAFPNLLGDYNDENI